MSYSEMLDFFFFITFVQSAHTELTFVLLILKSMKFLALKDPHFLFFSSIKVNRCSF